MRPTLEVNKALGPIDIDGDLTDAGWQDAARASNFSETDPGDNVKPPVDTEVFVTYDESKVYFAYIAYDDPEEVRASLRNRDDIWGDDYIGIILDTYADAGWAYELFVNPLGIQGDLRWVGNDEEDLGFDIVWESSGKITDNGYQVEVAVPFSSLRFPDRPVQSWRATFWRNRPRESRIRYSWAAMDRDEPCWVCNFGTLTGITDVKPGNNIELLPSIIGFRTSRLRDPDNIRSGLVHEDIDGEASLGIRYSISSSVSLAGTVNPDFSQIESDPSEIDVNTTFALFFPERRPFFQEGSDLFSTSLPAVYTRSINDPIFAVKVTGRTSLTNFAVISAQDENSPVILPFEEQSRFLLTGKSISNIMRVRRNYGDDSHIGGLVTDRRWENSSSGTILSADGGFRFKRKYRFEWQAAASHTEEPNDTTLTSGLTPEEFDDGNHTTAFDGERFWGHGLHGSLERSGRHWNFDLDYWERSPTLRAANGFLFRNDNREFSGWSAYTWRSDTGIFQRITPLLVLGRIWNSRGVIKDGWIVPNIVVQLKGQTKVEIEHIWSSERFRGIDFPNIRRLEVDISNEYLERLRAGIEIKHVHHIARNLDVPAMGKGTEIEAWVNIKPTTRMSIHSEFDYASLYRTDDRAEIFNGYISRTRFGYQFTREAALRLVLEYDEFDDAFNVEPLFSYRANPFTVFYLGWTQTHEDFTGPKNPAETRRQIFLKMQYLIQM